VVSGVFCYKKPVFAFFFSRGTGGCGQNGVTTHRTTLHKNTAVLKKISLQKSAHKKNNPTFVLSYRTTPGTKSNDCRFPMHVRDVFTGLKTEISCLVAG
jgi:hypothetical protein